MIEPWDFSAPHINPSSGYISPKDIHCRGHYRSDHLTFRECADELLQSAVASRHCRQSFPPALPPACLRNFKVLSSPGAGGGSGYCENRTEFWLSQQRPCQHPQVTHPPVLWVTHVTTCSLETNRLARAVTAAGIPLAVLGVGTFWKWRWGYRMRALHDFLTRVPDGQLILYSDSADVIPVPSASAAAIEAR